jgi:hypothetical protein
VTQALLPVSNNSKPGRETCPAFSCSICDAFTIVAIPEIFRAWRVDPWFVSAL